MDEPIEVRRRTKVEIMALQWTGENIDAFCQFLKNSPMYVSGDAPHLKRLILPGRGHLRIGDWYVTGEGILSDEQFKARYDKVLQLEWANPAPRAFTAGWQGR